MFRQVCSVFVVSCLLFCAIALGDDLPEEYTKLLGSSGEIYVMEYFKAQGYKVIPYPGKEPLGVVGVAFRDVFGSGSPFKDVVLYESVLAQESTLGNSDYVTIDYHYHSGAHSDMLIPTPEKSMLGEDWLGEWVKSMEESSDPDQKFLAYPIRRAIARGRLEALCEIHYIDTFGDRYLIYKHLNDLTDIQRWDWVDEHRLRYFTDYMGNKYHSEKLKNIYQELKKIPCKPVMTILHRYPPYPR